MRLLFSDLHFSKVHLDVRRHKLDVSILRKSGSKGKCIYLINWVDVQVCIKWDSRSLRRCSFNALTCCFFCKSICTLEQRNFCRKGKSCSARFTSRWNFEKWNSKNSHRTSFFQDLWIKVIFSRTFKTCFVCGNPCRIICITLHPMEESKCDILKP